MLLIGLFAFSGITCAAETVPVSIEFYPEWHPASGVMVSWLDFDAYYIDLVSHLSARNTVTVIVDSRNQLEHVRNLLTRHRVDTGRINFYAYVIDDIWIVDYGPLFIRRNRVPTILDLKYYRHLDDHLPEFLGAAWGLPTRDVPLFLEGGNIMTDGKGVFFTTTEILEQNEDMSESDIRALFRDTMGAEQLHILTRLDDGTGHVDMFAKLLDEDTLLLGQYSPEDPEYTVLESNARYIEGIVRPDGTPFHICRIPMPGEPGDYYSYTNSLILNREVFVPVYELAEDAVALSIYREAMPDYEIVPIVSLDPIFCGGAVHCTTRSIPDWKD